MRARAVPHVQRQLGALVQVHQQGRPPPQRQHEEPQRQPLGQRRVVLAGIEGMAPQRGQGRLPSVLRVQLEEYFAGARRTFDLPLAPVGSPFQLRVWEALREIPYGRTVSYSDVARKIADLESVRAVGAANGRNPLPIVVPCHRVIGADGSLVGFGGGLPRKRWLLAHEGAVAGDGDLFAR